MAYKAPNTAIKMFICSKLNFIAGVLKPGVIAFLTQLFARKMLITHTSCGVLFKASRVVSLDLLIFTAVVRPTRA